MVIHHIEPRSRFKILIAENVFPYSKGCHIQVTNVIIFYKPLAIIRQEMKSNCFGKKMHSTNTGMDEV